MVYVDVSNLYTKLIDGRDLWHTTKKKKKKKKNLFIRDY